jgi:1-acyl-sn-glycerol-3-phosphate acyltransferase
MWWLYLSCGGLLLLFPQKVLFFLRVSYTMHLFSFYTIIIRLWTKEDIQGHWTRHSTWSVGINLKKQPGSVAVLKGRNVMMLGNHRNFCDFIMHDVITEHTSNFLSRALVGFVFPFMAFISYITDGVWYFVRGQGKDLDEFFSWIDSKFALHKTGRTHLLVYPEGHRNLKKEPLPLRSGMIRYAFSRKLPLQMFMCSGYDNVMNEKKLSAEWGSVDVKYKVYEPIFTDSYTNFESLMNEIRVLFQERFKEVHG